MKLAAFSFLFFFEVMGKLECLGMMHQENNWVFSHFLLNYLQCIGESMNFLYINGQAMSLEEWISGPLCSVKECTFWSTSSWRLTLALLFLFLYLLCFQGGNIMVFHDYNDFHVAGHNFYALVYFHLIKVGKQ